MQTLPKVKIINRVVLTLEQRELLATASNRLGFLVVGVGGRGLYNKKIETRDVLNVMLDPDKRYFTVRTKWGDNCYPYTDFHEALRWAKSYLGYQECSDDYMNI